MDAELLNLIAQSLDVQGNPNGITRCAEAGYYTVLRPDGQDKKIKGKCFIYFNDVVCSFHIPILGTVTFKIKDADHTWVDNGAVTQHMVNLEDALKPEGFINVQIRYGQTKIFIISYPRSQELEAYMFEADGFAGSPQNIEVSTNSLKGKKKAKYEKLEDLFVSKAAEKECISALLSATPPVVDKKMNYKLGQRQKGSLVAWVDVLNEKHKILAINNDLLIRLLNKKIHGLKLGKSARSLRNRQTTAYRKYHRQFMVLIT
jgi:hypothetical protein